MNIKIKAATIVAGFAASALVMGLAVKLAFAYIPLQILGTIGALIVVGFLFSMMYTIILTQLENDKNIEDVVNKYKVDKK